MSAEQIVVFRVERTRYGLWMRCVQRLVRAVELVVPSGMPDLVVGMVDVGGCVWPVVSLRRRFGWRDRPVRASDFLILARSSRGGLALLVDEVTGVMQAPGDLLPLPDPLGEGADKALGLLRTQDGLIMIHDLDLCLTAGEEEMVRAITEGGGGHDR